tara:strand:+ start:235 stop:510 length:276 start_codon:yes stop_codon:yes gene_type:complete
MRKVSGVYLPKPPKGADHILLNVTDDCCGPKRRALVLIHDIDVLIGTEGKLKFVKANRGKVIKEFDPEYTWNGNYIQELEDEIKEKEKESK